MSSARVHREVVRLLEEREPGVLLDVPAGDGPVLEGARAAGWRTVELDLFPPPGFSGIKGDACAPLPFRDASFDCVVCMEGIEHFENQAAFVRECARVLRPGGLLILTTPNVMHISARLSHFWTGQRVLKRGFLNEHTTYLGQEKRWILHGHAFLVDVFRLRYFLRLAGLRVDRLLRGNWSSGSLLLSPLVPLFALAARLALRSRHRMDRRDPHAEPLPEDIEQDLVRIASSPVLLLSRRLFLTAIREESELVPVARSQCREEIGEPGSAQVERKRTAESALSSP